MAAHHVIGVDLANVYQNVGGELDYEVTLAWGDPVELLGEHPRGLLIGFIRHFRRDDGSVEPVPFTGVIKQPSHASGLSLEDVVVPDDQAAVLKVEFVDVQQGDGTVIETPKGRVVLLDGGELQLYARYLSTRFPGTSEAAPREIDAIVVSHGDADHFAGLTQIRESETNDLAYKRVFIHPRRVFHNGLVKRPSSRPESQRLGPIAPGTNILNGLVDDIIAVPDSEMNEPFRDWKAALVAWQQRGPIEMKRLALGDDEAFDFLRDESVDIEVLGPITVPVPGGGEGLEFLGRPKRNPRIASEVVTTDEARFTGKSASHTINGHSVVLRMRYGGFRFLFAGDLNEQAEETLLEHHRARHLSLRAEVFKVPHHGSHEYSSEFIRRVAPIVSVISSGDENERHEYIHPRANLVAALGKNSRPGFPEPVLFVTEMVAFFKSRSYVTPEFHKLKDGTAVVEEGVATLARNPTPRFFAFERAAFGIVKVRTDGHRLFLWTNSGQQQLKETYAFESAPGFELTPVVPRVAS
jgi:beta-lactamase superfamily II metal-dependent hydrolase